MRAGAVKDASHKHTRNHCSQRGYPALPWECAHLLADRLRQRLPGNFSHAALLYVDENTGVASVIEALIERGLVVTPLEEFVRETRLRLMVLRLRPDLPALVSDPQLPHRAAVGAFAQARKGHTPYDFTMDFRDHDRQFCAEVISSAYARCGVRLWTAMTSISSPTLVAWLSSLGVRHFETQEPSDLEFNLSSP